MSKNQVKPLENSTGPWNPKTTVKVGVGIFNGKAMPRGYFKYAESQFSYCFWSKMVFYTTSYCWVFTSFRFYLTLLRSYTPH